MNDPVVCQCNAVRASEALAVIAEYPFLSRESVRRAIGAGTRCGQCRDRSCQFVDASLDDILDIEGLGQSNKK